MVVPARLDGRAASIHMTNLLAQAHVAVMSVTPLTTQWLSINHSSFLDHESTLTSVSSCCTWEEADEHHQTFL